MVFSLIYIRTSTSTGFGTNVVAQQSNPLRPHPHPPKTLLWPGFCPDVVMMRKYILILWCPLLLLMESKKQQKMRSTEFVLSVVSHLY